MPLHRARVVDRVPRALSNLRLLTALFNRSLFHFTKNVDIHITVDVNSESKNNLEKDIAFQELFVEYIKRYTFIIYMMFHFTD